MVASFFLVVLGIYILATYASDFIEFIKAIKELFK
jgi:hypothetical protein